MPFLIIEDPNEVHYHGKILPQDKAPIVDQVVDPTVNYAGKTLPQQATLIPLAPPDMANNPKLIIIGGITLPSDTAMFINGKKIAPIEKILDGVTVIEHVSIDAHKIDFEGTFRPIVNADLSTSFPQPLINNFWKNVWKKDSVVSLVNTFFNNLGISELFIEDIHMGTVRGQKNVPFKLTTIENQPGLSIIVTPV